ncbi:hypothetical protein CHH55_00275 [Niallia circulans]|uniref:undecaprenyl-diphosphatase n=1 Tax=Niallia circulans TaxID=1397 RepID=UPI000BA51A8E|nr:undecaprenyl-diphosphatase [Niallia circulans]PAD89986.1 hypothetical protein CHH55_00275 [Niallia circulans]
MFLINYEWFQRINNYAGSHPLLDQIMVFFTEKAQLIYVVVLVTIWIIGKENIKYIAFLASITGALGLSINFLISLFYFEERPFVAHQVHLLLDHSASASFPSNHMTGAFSLSFAVFLHRKRLGVWLLLLAILTGISRIYVGHHYPFDVLGSIIIAIVASLFVYKTRKYFQSTFKLLMIICSKIPVLRKLMQ